MDKTCLNCGAVIHVGPFCEVCGQRNVHERLVFAELLGDLREQLFEMNLPWVYTLVELTRRPGKVCAEYLAGKRVRYVNPLKYLVYLTAIIAVTTSFLPVRYRLAGAALGDERQQGLNFLQRLVYNNPALLYLFVSLLMPFVIRVIFPRTRYNKTELNVVVMYLMGHLILLFTVTGIAGQLLIELMRALVGEQGFMLAVTVMVMALLLIPLAYTASVIRNLFALSMAAATTRAVVLVLLASAIFLLSRYLIFLSA